MWTDRAAELKFKYGVSWSELPTKLNSEFGLNLTFDQVRNRLRRHKQYKQGSNIEELSNDSLLDAIKKECSITDLTSKFSVSDRVLLAHIEDLKDAGYQVIEFDGKIKLCNLVLQEDSLHINKWTGDSIIRFGVVSDTHLCSKDQQITELNKFYDILAQEGIDTCYHAGDITEGVNMRQGHEYEVFKHGVDEQAEYVIENYPKRNNIITKFITGNHDHSGIKSAGTDIGLRIGRERDDMLYLGKQSARVMLTPNCSLDLVHPLDGASYAISYSTQKYIDSLSGGQKPNILFIGHHHKMFQLLYRNIFAFEAGTFQAQTKWMQGKRLSAHTGGWLITVHVDKQGSITRCCGEFVPVYVTVKDDY
jgi:predicted phosphodiesterase